MSAAEAHPGRGHLGQMPPPKFFQQCFLDCYYFILSFLDLDGNPGYCLNLCCTIKMHKNASFLRHKIEKFPGELAQ